MSSSESSASKKQKTSSSSNEGREWISLNIEYLRNLYKTRGQDEVTKNLLVFLATLDENLVPKIAEYAANLIEERKMLPYVKDEEKSTVKDMNVSILLYILYCLT